MRRVPVLLGVAAASWFGAAWIATAYAAAPAPVQAGLPEGEGKAVVEKLCSTCHGLEYLAPSRRTVRNWLETIELMKSFGAEATDEQWTTIAAYIVDNLAVLNVNKAGAEEFTWLFRIDQKAAQAVVEYRDKQGGFKTIDDVKKAPGLDAGKIDALADRLIVE